MFNLVCCQKMVNIHTHAHLTVLLVSNMSKDVCFKTKKAALVLFDNDSPNLFILSDSLCKTDLYNLFLQQNEWSAYIKIISLVSLLMAEP